jgi:malonyl CoA-acyl carrier protein transacylase
LFAAGAFSFETWLKLVKKRGELMSQVTEGGMIAVIGLDAEQIEKVLKTNGLEKLDIANYNSKFQIVISGSEENIESAKKMKK